MIITKEFRFEAAHNLLNYEGKCKNLHGHTYKLLISLDCPVGENGLAYDFVDLENIVKEKIIGKLDHSYLNDILSQSSAEYIVIWIWEQLKSLPLSKIKLYETPYSSVSYHGKEQHLYPLVLKKTSN